MFAATHPENAASQIVLEKIGMKFDKKIEQYRMNLMNYVVSRENYRPKKIFYKLTCETLGKLQIDSKAAIQGGSF
ncbi:MAG: GNAT family N-acetyltransferase [Pyrinomonadaceae bacterium]|nr:GNAT family N-acetyltransferase [Pyrinomonadaceae bacterium]